ncbi:unnamed protein product [Sphenostylis stenocarpa]|uniref:HTH La-type RNA-binding domain-containing protein n=1 Tax=Sphenostylis stenocarpa TaxID=92480 RepID=A0AA86SIA8_9FABA|nr:unnamed protein product [Sphenostylis stenocarpa]
MDDQGWVPIKLIAGFNKVIYLTDNIQIILEAVRNSSAVEVQGDKIRRRNDWRRWIMPPPVQFPNATTLGEPDMLAEHVHNIALETSNYDGAGGLDFLSDTSQRRSTFGDLSSPLQLSTSEGTGQKAVAVDSEHLCINSGGMGRWVSINHTIFDAKGFVSVSVCIIIIEAEEKLEASLQHFLQVMLNKSDDDPNHTARYRILCHVMTQSIRGSNDFFGHGLMHVSNRHVLKTLWSASSWGSTMIEAAAHVTRVGVFLVTENNDIVHMKSFDGPYRVSSVGKQLTSCIEKMRLRVAIVHRISH